MSLSVMLIYGSYLGYGLLSQTYEELLPTDSPWRPTQQSWVAFLNIWSVVIATDLHIGAISLLMLMTAPLAMAFLVYHTYLIWAGMTTNESAKWSDWKEDVADGMVFRSTKAEIYDRSPLLREYQSPPTCWPVSSDQVIVFTDGEAPREGCVLSHNSNDIRQPHNFQIVALDQRWVPVRSMREIDNIYDLGFWDNLRHVFNFPTRRKKVC
ncbi:hypothetical protein EYZ11_009939 [Aspergillus tanneri]|uniref:Palmitoyltransferase n=1 Tax=Aspergillus tanneri TaxID=1220188 RepID=A0A4S3J8T8_9EURO|nr:hypothetical protein EYZ11_009939 [Aspergillus tanneri]